MEVSLLHPENALFPIVSSPSGSAMDVRLSQSQNALYPIIFSSSGSVMEVRLFHQPEKNASSQMTVTVLGTTYDSKPYGALSSLFLSGLNFTPYSSV